MSSQKLNVLGISEMVMFKGNEMTLKVPKESDKNLENQLIVDGYKTIGISVKKHREDQKYKVEDFYQTGVLLDVKRIQQDNTYYTINVKAIEKIAVDEFFEEGGNLSATYSILDEVSDVEGEEQKELHNKIIELVKEVGQYFKGSEGFVKYVEDIQNISILSGVLLQYLNISVKEKYQIFETPSYKEKGLLLIDALIKQKELYAFQKEISDKFSKEANQNYRKAFLREQLKVIQEELNEEEGAPKKKDFGKRIEESLMPEEVKESAREEFRKFEALSPQSTERNVISNYLETLLSLPWGKFKAPDIDLTQARQILDDAHYGLDDVKNRIIQHLAVMKLKEEKQGSILLLVGPPGTGKTSLGKSIASALERPYVRMSLGGVRDEAEIRGHRRTYVAALPGRIIQGMKRATQTNPVFVLDEIDKLMVGASGDPASALLEVLDPEQNGTFRDHYLEQAYDLSDVFFIATANSLRGIPGPLLDRMEVIEVSSYTNTEKYHIARQHLIKDVWDDHGITSEQLQVTEDGLKRIIDDYTREAGVRSLKRQLAAIARAASEKIVMNTVTLPYVIDAKEVEVLLGHPKVRHEMIGKENLPGVSTGMAWTPVGGEILFIETSFMPGNGKLILTGKLGDVMKESAQIALSLVRSRLAMNTAGFEFNKRDLHIHVPSGAVPKDGPSAGVALFSAISSLVLGRSIPSDISMTGEVSLRGTVLPVGGIKEKVIAAHRAGIKQVLLPIDNEKDIEDIPEEVRNDLTFHLMSTIEEVIKFFFDIDLPDAQSINPFETSAPEMTSH